MAPILTDSDVLIDAMRQREPSSGAVRRVLAQGDLVVSSVSAYELLSGCRSEREERDVVVFLERVPILDLDFTAAQTAGHVARILASVGLRLDAADCLIAGIALANTLPLLTRNVRHFERVPGLEVVTV